MTRYLVLYFSRTGNSRFLASRIGRALRAEVREMRPFTSHTGLLILLSGLGISTGTGVSAADMDGVDEVVVCGPIWAGLLIAPLRAAIRQAARQRRPVHLALSCGNGDDEKDGTWGYAQVLRAATRPGGAWLRTADAFPCGLAATTGATDAGVRRLTEDNFRGAIAERLDAFVERVTSGNRAPGST